MAVKVDLDAREVVCSVHDLLPESVRRTLGMPGEGLARLTVGSELHRIVQAGRSSTDPGYRSEVAIDCLLELDGWRLRIVGRADGVTHQDGTPIVEEIKTLHFRTELFNLFAKERLDRYRWQVRIYAFALFPDGAARARLALVDLGGDEQRFEEVPWSPTEVRAYLRARMHALVGAARQREAVLERWRVAAASLSFPHESVRPVQTDAAEAVEAALATGRHLLLAAPTGVGKTAAALFPAVRFALATGKRVAFLTAKTMQQHLAVETLNAMNRGGWRSLQLRAKAKMCANREVICHEEYCDYARDYGLKLADQGVVEGLLAGPPHLDPDRIFETCRTATVCPFEVSLELLGGVTAAVCDYNYVFDPGISLFGTPLDGTLEDLVLVVDEAHNLVDRAREYYSPKLARSVIDSARALVSQHNQRVCRDLGDALDELEGVLDAAIGSGLDQRKGTAHADLDPDAFSSVRLALDGLIVPYFSFKRQTDLWLARDPVVDVLLTLARLTDLLEDGGKELVPLVERSDRNAGADAVRLLCVDASRFTGALIEASATCVAMSATLEPFEFYRDLLGFDPDRTDEVALPSPFPPENRLVMAVDEVDTSYRFRSSAYGRIAELVSELAPEGRNALVLFPSYAFLNEVAGRLIAPGHRVEIQRIDDSDRMRREMLTLLRANDAPVLLLAVLGGVFAEGVDYPGEMLSEVIVVSPALPQVGPEREILKRYYQEAYDRGFEYAYLVPGMTRVVQAAGRLIRSETDRGVITLICRRFLREPYASLLPTEWTGGAVESLHAAEPVAAVRAFFGTPSPS